MSGRRPAPAGRIGSGSSSRASSHASLHVTGSSTLNGNAAAAQSEHTGATSTESTSRMERRVQRAASGAASRASSSASIPSAFSITAAAVVSTVPPPIRDGSRESIVARTLAAAEAAAAVAAEVDARRPLLAMADMPRPLRESVNGNTDTDMAVDHHDDNDDDDDENDDGIDSEVHVRWRQERLTNGRTFADEDAHLASLASGVLEHFLRRGLVNRAMRHAGEDDDEDDSENDEDDIDVTMMEVGLSQRTSLASLGANIDPLTQRYIHQLLFGCARQICDNPFCANNPNFALTGTPEVAQIAQTLARMGQSSLCPDVVLGTGERDGDDDGAGVHTPTRGGISEFARNASEPVPPLSLELVRTELAAARESGSYVKLMQLLYSNFASVEKLATCFQRIVTPPEGPIQTAALPPARLNTDEMNEFYSTVIECPTSVMNCIVTATATLLDKFKLGSSQVQSNEPSTLDALVILFSNPIIMDSTYHASLLTRMTDLLAGLGAPVKEAFAQRWAESYMQVPFANMAKALTEQAERKKQLTEELSRLVAVLQHLITMRIYTITTRHAGEPPVLNKDLVVVDATRCLAVFYTLNCELKLISHEEFYNDAVNEQMDIKDDFPHWKAKEGFSFCNYPFILNPAVKSDILKVESMVQMRHELQDAFFRAMFIGVNSPYLVLEIRRDHIIRDALYQLESRKTQDLKKQLKVQFVGEEGVDEGGVQKEFFQLVVRELFDQKYGIFKMNDESHTFWFTTHGLDDDQFVEELRLVGRLVGLAIYNGVILDVHFPLALWKKIMGVDVDFDDLLSLDPMLHRTLKQLLDFDGDVEEVFGRTFQVDIEVFGTTQSIDLCPNGANINLTNENRREFVRLYADFILNRSISKGFTAFKEGFDMVCSDTAISLFRPEEVELLVCGSEDLDFAALQAVTSYDGGFSPETPVIKHFWDIVLQFDDTQKKKLLFFATGTDRVPIGGLSKLSFIIAKNGPDSDRLPSSHTCFNVLLLPEYAEREKLKERLLTAIQNSEGFGMI